MSQLTSLQLIAGAELANNQGIGLNVVLTENITAFDNTSLIQPLKAVYSNSSSLSANVLSSLTQLGSANCPALADSTPQAQAANVGLILGNAALGNSVLGFTGLVEEIGLNFLGNGDVSKFTQIVSSVQGYMVNTNNYILSTKNSNTWLGNTFTNMNNLITGGLSEVNLAFRAFGSDLQKLGRSIDLANLNNLGSPLAVWQQIANVAEITPALSGALIRGGYDIDIITSPPTATQQILQLEKFLYTVMTTIKDSELSQILNILDVSTANLTTMADLLNPVKIFPASYDSLTVKTSEGLRGIYLPNSTTINSLLLTALPGYVLARVNELQVAIPPDQALACQALRTGLQQIKKITETTLAGLAAAYLASETTKDLPLINALTQPVPAGVQAFYNSTFETGSGPDGTLVIGDFLGVCAGFEFNQLLANTTNVLISLTSAGTVANLTICYSRMANTVNGLYGDPLTGPVTIPAGIAAGTYANADVAFDTALIPSAQTFIDAVITANSTAANTLNSNYQTMANLLIDQNQNLTAAGLDLANLIPNQRSSVLGFVSELPAFGIDTSQYSFRQFFESVANVSSLGGQAVIGCMREGVNTQVMNTAGLGLDTVIPAVYTQIPQQANLIPSTYSESQAANLVIT